MKKFLITGAAGFIGLNLTEFLLNKGYTVKGVDNFYTSDPSIYKNVFSYLKEKYSYNYSFKELDVKTNKTIKEINKFKPNYIVHLAAIPSVSRSIKNPSKSLKNNINSTINIAVAALEVGVKKLIYAGSSSFYGGRLREGELPLP